MAEFPFHISATDGDARADGTRLELLVRHGDRDDVPRRAAERRFLEFFAAQIRNSNTRRSHSRAAADFLAWCGDVAGVTFTRITERGRDVITGDLDFPGIQLIED